MDYRFPPPISGDLPNKPAALLPPRPIVFVVELGMRFQHPPTQSHNNHHVLGALLAVQNFIKQAGILECPIREKNYNDFRTWCITENRDDKCWFDIVSPKLVHDHRNSWIIELHRIYTAVGMADCIASNLWSTKIHIVIPPVMAISELRALAQTVIHHNHGFNSLAWELRTKDVHRSAQSLFWIPDLSSLGGTRKKTLDSLHSTKSVEGIAELMNTDQDGKGHIRAWNFWPVVATNNSSVPAHYYTGRRFTNLVEYNLAPGSATPEDATMWIDLACLFVRGALKHRAGWVRGTAKGSDPTIFRESDLSKFVLEQAEDAGLTRAEKSRIQERLAFLSSVDNGQADAHW